MHVLKLMLYSFFLPQNFLEKTNAKDASGNIVFGDIGVHIQQEVSSCNYLYLVDLIFGLQFS